MMMMMMIWIHTSSNARRTKRILNPSTPATQSHATSIDTRIHLHYFAYDFFSLYNILVSNIIIKFYFIRHIHVCYIRTFRCGRCHCSLLRTRSLHYSITHVWPCVSPKHRVFQLSNLEVKRPRKTEEILARQDTGEREDTGSEIALLDVICVPSSVHPLLMDSVSTTIDWIPWTLAHCKGQESSCSFNEIGNRFEKRNPSTATKARKIILCFSNQKTRSCSSILCEEKRAFSDETHFEFSTQLLLFWQALQIMLSSRC